MNSFVVSVKGDRLNASYTVLTLGEALTKAAVVADLGVVRITDPTHRDYELAQFQELRDRWAHIWSEA